MPDPRSVEPALTARRSLGQPVALLLGVLAVVFTGYRVASLSRVGGFFQAAVRSTRSNGVTALDPVLYGVAGLAAFVIMLGVLRFFDSMFRRFRKTTPEGSHSERSIEQFASDAAEAQISPRVARESYELLQHYYPDRMSIDLDHDLRADLKLTDNDILQLHTGLLSRTERREMRDLTAANIDTVHDLVEYVDKAPAQHLGGVAVQVRSTELPSAECVAAGASGLSLGDQASGQRRRASDYIGPRRRASDNKVKRAYSGPHRRATDVSQAASAGKSGERPREGSPEHKVADMNQREPHFVARDETRAQ